MDKMKKNPKKAMWLSLIPGAGQLYNGQKLKGIVLLLITVAFLAELFTVGFSAVVGLFTLGSTPALDNSLFMMIEGVLQLLLIVVMILYVYASMQDAKKVAIETNEGQKPNNSVSLMFHNLVETGFPYLLTFPAWILMLFTIVFPVIVTVLMAFTNYDFLHIPPASLLNWVGFKNFLNIFVLSSYRATFQAVFGWTVIWTLLASTLQIIIGLATAIIANQDFIKFKRIYGVIFLLPWAIPAFISIMSFSNMFNDSAGAINVQVLGLLNHIPFVHISAIPWLTNAFWTKTAIIMIQGWLGFPYIYIMVTGVLQAIPEDLYEAATLDGATAWQKFRNITAPTIFTVAAPIFITQYTFNFNNFSMIYLFNGGGPGDVGGGAGGTDILISWIYKLTTGQSPQYSIAAAVTLLISVIVIGISLVVFKKSNSFDLGD